MALLLVLAGVRRPLTTAGTDKRLNRGIADVETPLGRLPVQFHVRARGELFQESEKKCHRPRATRAAPYPSVVRSRPSIMVLDAQVQAARHREAEEKNRMLST